MKLLVIIFVAFLMVVIGFSTVPVWAQPQCYIATSVSDTIPPYAGVHIKSNSAATFSVKGPSEFSSDEYSGTRLSWSKFDAPPGTYTITWGSISGCITPPQETKELKQGGSILFIGFYNEAAYPQGKGTIKVRPVSFPPPYPHFTLKGPATRTGELDHFWEEEMPAGTYTITYEELDDHGAPPPETKTLERNGTITFDAAYGPPKTHVFTIDSKPPGANVYLDGSFLGNAPVKARIPQDTKEHAIRCSLQGYEDYNRGGYQARVPGSTSYSIGAKLICEMSAKKDSSSLKNMEEDVPLQEQVEHNKVTPPSSPLDQKPQGFFSRIWRFILSLFKK